MGRSSVRLLPMTDGAQATMIELASGEEVSFQDYFVRLHHDVPVRGVRFGGDGAGADARGARPRLETAATIVVAPSNPIVSIGPLRALPGVDDAARPPPRARSSPCRRSSAAPP